MKSIGIAYRVITRVNGQLWDVIESNDRRHVWALACLIAAKNGYSFEGEVSFTGETVSMNLSLTE